MKMSHIVTIYQEAGHSKDEENHISPSAVIVTQSFYNAFGAILFLYLRRQ